MEIKTLRPHITNFQSRLRALSLTLVMFWCATPNLSATVMVANGLDPARSTDIYIWTNGIEQLAASGVMSITVDNTWNRFAFCADAFTDIFFGNNNSSGLVGVDQIANGAWAAYLIGNYMPIGTEPNAAVLGSAMQLALWDIIHDGGDGFDAGLIRKGQANVTDANVLAAAINFENVTRFQSTLNGIVYVNVDLGLGVPSQTLIGPLSFDGGPVPEPETYVLVGAGLLALLTGAKRLRLSN